MSNSITLITAGGHIQCVQCQAKAKSTQQQCRRPATSGKRTCKLHGGLSSGPRTPEGRLRCAAAKTIHGNETIAKRLERSMARVQLAAYEEIGHALGFMHGPRTRGPKSNRIWEVELELQAIVRNYVLGVKT